MANLVVFFLAFSCLLGFLHASAGDANPHYKTCVQQCERTGCVGDSCFHHCKSPSNGVPVDGPWYMQEPLYLRWKQWDCGNNCRYHCMLEREKERETLGIEPVKYHGKWPFKRIFGIQEPVSVALSTFNLAMQFHGWMSFFVLLYYKLPLRPQNRKTYYEYTGLWHIYGLLAMNSWFWSAVFHSRDVDLTEKLDYSSAVALLGYTLIITVLRTFNVRDEAVRVTVAAPLIAFVTTHILYLNVYKLDYGFNMKVCVIMGLAQLLLWAFWAALTGHPSRFKLWAVVFGGGLAMLLEIYDFPPYQGYVDAHALWHAATVPLTYLWWGFIKDDAEFRTSNLINKWTPKLGGRWWEENHFPFNHKLICKKTDKEGTDLPSLCPNIQVEGTEVYESVVYYIGHHQHGTGLFWADTADLSWAKRYIPASDDT